MVIFDFGLEPTFVATFVAMEWIVAAIILHLTVTGFLFIDLRKKSKRKNKIIWALFIALIPLIGAIMYRMTMKRRIRYAFLYLI